MIRGMQSPRAFNKYVFFLLTALILYLLFLNSMMVYRNYKLKQEQSKLEDSIKTELAREAQLQTRLEEAKSGESIERLARIKLGLIKKGEIAYQIIKK